MSLSSKASLVQRMRRGKKPRQQFVESHLTKTLAYQIRATRESLHLSQSDLAELVATNQNAIYRLESPSYGRPTLTTLKRIAAAMDVALIVRLVPFSELVDWVSGTPRVNRGIATGALAVPDFQQEEQDGVFDATPEHQRATTLYEVVNSDVQRGLQFDAQQTSAVLHLVSSRAEDARVSIPSAVATSNHTPDSAITTAGTR